MNSLTLYIFIAAAFTIVSAQKCPAGWYGYSLQSKCYRFFSKNAMTWSDSRDFCKIHGGDLLRIDSAQEQSWVFRQLRNMHNHSHIPATHWWVGMNNREFLTKWEWADGAPVGGFIHWRPGEPNNAHGAQGGERCGEVWNINQFNDAQCSTKYKFICWRNRGIPLVCDADRNWQALNGACYKVYSQRMKWNAAQHRCSHDGAALVTVDNVNDEISMHDFALTIKQPLWIGLYTQKVGTKAQWMWTNGTSISNNYWHGTPHVGRTQLNSTCAAVTNAFPYQSSWVTSSCNVNRPFVCRKPEGVCLPGWFGHRNNCWQFNAQYKLNFNAAKTFCRQQGATLLKIGSDSDEMFLISYLDELRDSGVANLWIGASDKSPTDGQFKWADGSAITYKHWAYAHNTAGNTKNRKDCVYVRTSDKAGLWRRTVSCQSAWPFICKIPMGKNVTQPPRTPRPRFGCPADWRLFQQSCFHLGDRGLQYAQARNVCQQTQGADLAKITAANMQGFINRLAKHDVNYWLGLNDRVMDGSYVWNSETTALTSTSYTNWRKGEPNNYGHRENCVVLKNGQWNDYNCAGRAQYVCSMTAGSPLASLPPSTPQPDWTVKCGPGWESNPLTANCYMFVDQPLSWLDALSQCQSFKGHLVAIEDSTEINYLAARTKSMNSLAVWTGANDRGTEGGWKWVYNKPFAYFNWAPGQPSSSGLGQGQDCVAMFTQSALWDDVSCDNRNGYICEKLGRVPRTTAQTTPTVRIPAGKVLGCNRGWLPFRNNCYRIVRQSATRTAAQTTCGRMSSKLSSVADRNENNFIAGRLPKATHSWDGYWISLNDIQIDNRFQWSDGSVVTYTNWNTNEPNNWNNRNEDCVTMLLTNGKWNDEKCSDIRPGFVCKTPKSAVSATQAPYHDGCNWNAYGVGAKCYKLVNYGKPMTWNVANSYCNRTFKGQLATVNDRILQAFLSSMLVWKSGYFWIGMTDTASPGTYKWLTGDSVRYTNWYSTHTGNERSTCIAMEATPPTGLWVNRNCSTPGFSICEFPRAHYTPTTTPTPWPNVNCPSGWTTNQGFCYKAFANQSTVKTWMEAVTYCQTLGGNLPSFHINNNDSVLATLLSNYRGKPFWIGLNDRDTEKGHKWSDGSAVDYTHWNPGEPNDFHGYEDCVVYNPGGGWNDQNCYLSTRFVCAVPRGTNISAVTPAPTGVASAQYCGDMSWLLYNGNCYQFSPTTGDNSSLSWYDANTYCTNQQSNLVSMHTQDEHSFVLSYITKRKSYAYWTGLNSLNDNGFKWSDQTAVDFDFWSPGEPNNYFGSEQCVEMMQSYGLWNDDHCSQTRPFICKKPKIGAAAIATPAPFPSGGCAQGFTLAPGGRNKCFYIGGANPSSRVNYTAAYQLCRRFGTGYDIASIEDIFEQEFLLTMIKGITYPLWIGLNDRHGNNKFYWQNSVPVMFTNWDRGEPTSSHQGSPLKNRQNCVLMRTKSGHEGRWADMFCSPKMGYICQSKQDPNLPKLGLPKGNCKTGYSFYMGGCYKVSTTSKNWNDAQADCKTDGGNLASVNNVQESAFIHILVNGKFQYWVGLSDTQTRGLYQWVDNWPVFFSNWGWKEPSYGRKNSTGCVLVNMRGKWNDTACTRKVHYVCKISQVSPPKPTAVSKGNCSVKNAIPNPQNDYCYSVYTVNGRSWPEANYLCQSKGQQLVSIHSQAELDFVVQIVRQSKSPNPSYRPNAWIGLQQGGKGSYTWTDGTTLNFIKWKVGEPSNIGTHGQLEQCVELDRDNATYNDISCFTNKGYVCKSPKVMPTSGPFIPGSGGPGVPTGKNGLPIYVAPTGPGGVLIGVGSSMLPSLTNAQGQPVSPNALGQSSNNVQTNNSNLGLSNGGIAGVVIACVLVLIIAAFMLIYLKRMGKIKPPVLGPDSSLGFENATYSRSNDKIQLDSDA